MSDEILNSEDLSDGMKAVRAAFRNAMELAWKHRIAYIVGLCECHIDEHDNAEMVMSGSCLVPTQSEAIELLRDVTQKAFEQGYSIGAHIDQSLSRDEIYDECVVHTKLAWQQEWDEENKRRGLD
jgi:hypothetical protein